MHAGPLATRIQPADALAVSMLEGEPKKPAADDAPTEGRSPTPPDTDAPSPETPSRAPVEDDAAPQASAAPVEPSDDDAHHRPLAWIVLSCMLAVAVIGL